MLLAPRPRTDAPRPGSLATYTIYGMYILSELPLPSPALCQSQHGPPDWIIRRAAQTTTKHVPSSALMAESIHPDGTVADRFYRDGDLAWLWDRRAGIIQLEPLRGLVTVFPHPEVDEDDLSLVLLGPAFSFMLHLTGYPNLHASAVLTQHGACAFIGPSTQGKTTLAAAMLRRGASLLSDDILPLRFDQDGVYGVPSAPLMKVWPSTAREALGIVGELPRLTLCTDKRLLDLRCHGLSFADRPAHLRAIYVPRRYDPVSEGRSDIRVEPLSPRDALLVLLSQAFRGHYLWPRELAQLLTQYAQLARQARVAVVRIPDGPEYQDAVTERILGDLAEL
jgi:hypothetical protein